MSSHDDELMTGLSSSQTAADKLETNGQPSKTDQSSTDWPPEINGPCKYSWRQTANKKPSKKEISK